MDNGDYCKYTFGTNLVSSHILTKFIDLAIYRDLSLQKV